MIRTLIPASRTGLRFPLPVTTLDGEWTDTAEIHANKVRSLLAAGDIHEWSFQATDVDGYTHTFTFDGAEVVRTICMTDSDGISAILGISQAERMANVGKPFADGTPSPMADVAPRKVSDRNADARRDYCRRKVAQAMGFSRIKDWKAAGYPVDANALPAKVKALLPEAQLGTLVGNVTAVSGIRSEYHQTGRFQGHSHNN